MPERSRTLHLPVSMDTRTCSRWACLQRIPGTGPDPTVLSSHVEQLVRHVASTVIEDAEVKGSLQATEHYVRAFLDQYWCGMPPLIGPRYPKPLLAVAEERGAMCIETLVEWTMPRLQYAERLLAHTQPFEWTIPDGTGGELVIPGMLARLGEDRLTGVLRIYDWQIEEQRYPHLNALLRFQQTGVALGWLQATYPDREAAYVDVCLATDTAWEWRRTPQELHLLEELLRQQTTQVQSPRPFGAPPVQFERN